MVFKCPSCDSKFTRKSNLRSHFTLRHTGPKNVVSCFLCGCVYNNTNLLEKHHKDIHSPSKYFHLKESAFKKTAAVYRYIYDNNTTICSAEDALGHFMKKEVRKTLNFESLTKNAIKASIILIVQFARYDEENIVIGKASIPFRSETFTVSPKNQIDTERMIDKSFDKHQNLIEEFINNGSNWVFDRAIAMDIDIIKIKPILSGCDNFDISSFKNNKQLISVPSTNNKCFLYCVIERLYQPSACANKDYESYMENFNLKGISFPIDITDIVRFVKQNKPLNIKINILMASGKDIFPLKCGIGEGQITVNLLLVHSESGHKAISHYLLIRNLDRFLLKSYKTENKKMSYERAFFCPNCFNKFSVKASRDKHTDLCTYHKARIEKVPDNTNNKIFFRKHENKFPQRLIGYLDFECVLVKTDQKCENCATVRCKCDSSYTRFENEQKPICFSFLIINQENEIMYSKTYSGDNAGDVFISDLLDQETLWIKDYLTKSLAMEKMNEEETIYFEISESCYICEQDFTEADPKVRDHDHSTGFFVGAAHNSCNLKRKRQNVLKIFMHNGAKYDFHIIVKSLANKKLKNIYILPYNMENFRVIKFNSFMMLDSIAFLQASLGQLAQELYDSNHDYPIIKQSDLVKSEGYFDNDKFQMVLKKGHFCYEYW